MKKVILLFAVTLSFVAFVNASTLPNDVKQEILNRIEYPSFAQENMIEGEVWMKVSLKDNDQVQIIEISSTNPELKKYVQKELSKMTLKNTSIDAQDTYLMKVKFELI